MSPAIFWITAITALAFHFAVTGLQIYLTVVALIQTTVNALALTASVLDICSAIGIAVLVSVRHALPSKQRLVLVAIALIMAVLAAIFTAISLAWVIENADRLPFASAQKVHSLAYVGFALWAVAVLSHMLFFGYQFGPHRASVEPPGSQSSAEHSSSARSVKPTLSLQLAMLAPPRSRFLRSTSAPCLSQSGRIASPRSSTRHSVQQVLRPVTSKSRLIFRQSGTVRDSRSTYSGWRASLELPREYDGFEFWDTSGVDEPSRTTNMTQSRSGRLETIHSRPVSPAKALDGPFNASEEFCLSESPLPSPFATAFASPSETSSVGGFPLPNLSRRPSSTQSHIHPLFRSESPVPPPLASPGTVITASPLAGQVVSADQVRSPRALHSAQSNRPPSATPGSRPGSVRNCRVRSPSPVDGRTALSSQENMLSPAS